MAEESIQIASITRTEDLKSLEFLALNSKEIIEKQVDSYRQQHSYAGTIIGATALFIPFFLGSFDGPLQVIQYISIVPTSFFILSILLMLSIFRTRPLDQAFNATKYKDLIPKTYRDVLLYEIEANVRSYTMNKILTEKGNKRYAKGVSLTIIALLSSIVLIMVNKFIGLEKGPTKVQVVSPKSVVGYKSIKSNNDGSSDIDFITKSLLRNSGLPLAACSAPL